jgi:adenosylmethionine-8-amino-7-oxononanoate aminotransferase
LRVPFEPLVPGGLHVANTDRYRCPMCAHAPGCTLACADEIEEAIVFEGPETVAAVFLEPVQNAGGCIPPPPGYFERVREICDRYGVLLVSDEVICAFGRLGTMFGCDRYGYQPDMITTAKGMTSGYAPLGSVIASDGLVEPFLDRKQSFAHGITFGGHPVSCAVSLANLDVFDREAILEHVRAHEGELEERLESLLDIPIVGEVRGAGYFWAMELVKDRDTKAGFSAEESEDLLRGFLSPRLYEAGLVCRADDRGDPVVQLAPPLIADRAEFDFIEATLRTVLTEAWKRIAR